MISNIFEHILELFSFLGPRKPIEYKTPKSDKEAFKQDAKAIAGDFKQVGEDLKLTAENFLSKYK